MTDNPEMPDDERYPLNLWIYDREGKFEVRNNPVVVGNIEYLRADRPLPEERAKALECVDKIQSYMNKATGYDMPCRFETIRQSLQAPAVDVETLKDEVRKSCPKGFYKTQVEVIDHLVSQGIIKAQEGK